MTLVDFAERTRLLKFESVMGVDRAYVSGLELGQRNPTILTLWHITKALGVTLKTFFDEEKPRRRVSREKN